MAEDRKATRAGPKRKAGAKEPAAAKKPASAKRPAATKPATAAAPAVPAPAASAAPEASPLDGRPGAGRSSVVMVEHPHLGKITLRGRSGDKAFMDAVTEAVGAAPPVEANTVTAGDGNEILWLGPDEWLVVTPASAQGAVEAALRGALAGQHASVVDTTDSQTTIRIHGAHARDVLAKGCPLDLHPRAFGPGRCAQSIVAKADALIHQRDDAPTYDVFVRCSFARYLWDWLVDAAREFD